MHNVMVVTYKGFTASYFSNITNSVGIIYAHRLRGGGEGVGGEGGLLQPPQRRTFSGKMLGIRAKSLEKK